MSSAVEAELKPRLFLGVMNYSADPASRQRVATAYKSPFPSVKPLRYSYEMLYLAFSLNGLE